ncbi:response regulator [Candidatus Saccharibacteria bacterium]|nr:response regulator [Candidatus Saccharibacteria bacterium]
MARVLIVEDDAWQREHVSRVLTKHGYQTAESAHALEAIVHIDVFKPDVIVLDIMLPGPNGFVLLHELQSHSDLARIPIIVMSTHSDVTLEELQPYGVKVVLDKASMRPDDIVAAVRKVT